MNHRVHKEFKRNIKWNNVYWIDEHFGSKKESRIRLWNMVVHSSLYKNELFQNKNIERIKITGKTWEMQNTH